MALIITGPEASGLESASGVQTAQGAGVGDVGENIRESYMIDNN